MRLTRHRRWMAPVAAAAAVGLALTACTGDIADGGRGRRRLRRLRGVRHLRRRRGHDLRHDPRPRGRPARSSPGPTSRPAPASTSSTRARASSRRRSRSSPRAATRPTSASSRSPACSRRLAAGGWLIPASEAVEANVDEFWSEDWKDYGTVDDTFYARAAHGEHQGLRLVLAGRVRGEGLRDPDDPRRARRRCPRRSRPRATTSRGASASSPVTRPAGRAPTGSRTTCCACTAPRSTTSGSPTRSRSTTRRSSRRSTRSGEYLKNEDMVNGGIGDVSTQITRGLPEGGLPILDGDVLAAPPGLVLRDASGTPRAATPTRSRPTATCSRFLLPPAERRRPAAGDRWRRVLGRVP